MNTLLRSASLLFVILPVSAFAQVAPPTAANSESVDVAKPGFFKFPLGKFTIVALDDGVFQLATDQLLIDDKPGVTKAILAARNEAAMQPTSVNAYLIDTGSKRILVDTGSGTYFGPTLGFMLARLKAAGYRPEDINEILITHLHPDHVGGLSVGGRMVFPNAMVRVADTERAFWLDKANAATVDASVKSSFDTAALSLAPYIAAGRVTGLGKAASLEAGISVVTLPGHTAGHTGYRVYSDGQTMLIWGDVMHVAAVQLKDPAVTIRFDSTPSQAYRSRLAIMNDAARGKYFVAGAHFAFPGIGTLGKWGPDWTWTPIGTAK